MGTSSSSHRTMGRWALAAALAAFDLLVGGAVFFSTANSQDLYRRIARTQSENLTKVLEESVSSSLAKIDLTLHTVAAEIRHQVETVGGIDATRLEAHLGQQLAHLPEAVGLQVVKANGDIEYIANRARSTKANIADRDHFIRTRDDPNAGLVIGKPILGRVSGKWVIIVARRLENPDGTFAGQVQASVLVETLARSFAGLDLGPNGSVSLWDLSPSIVARYSARTGGVGEIGATNASARLKNLLAQGTMAETYLVRTLLDDVTRQVSFRRFANLPLFVVVGLAEGDFLAPWRREAAWTGGLTFLFLVAINLAAWQMNRNLSRLHSARTEAEAARRSSALILDSAGEGICGLDPDGKITFLNRAARRMLGFSSEEGVGLALHGLTHHHRADGSAYPATDCPLYHTLKDGKPRSERDDVFWRLDGTSFPVEFTVAAIAVEDRVEGAVTVFRDIGERKAAEAALQRQESLVRAILEASSDSAFLLDTEGRLLATNSRLPGRFGKTVEEVLGTSIFDLFPPGVREAREANFREVVQTGESRLVQDQRAHMHLENRLHPLFGPDGKVDRVAVFSRDITEQVTGEQRLQAALAEAQRSNAELQQFAYAISHDLQEPLRTIVSYLQLLERRYKGKLDDQADEFIQFTVDGGKRMQALIRDILDYSRISTQGKEFSLVDGEEILKEARENLHLALAESGAEVSHGPLPDFDGDAAQLVRLFQNLIGNAVKYRRPEVPPKVEVDAERRDDTWVIRFKDNGIGIEAQHFQRIFEIFQRLHTREEYEGTGVGLAVCKKIVERHGGRIWVESEFGRGSTFFVALPVPKARS